MNWRERDYCSDCPHNTTKYHTKGKHKPNFAPLIDFLLMLLIGGGLVTILLCIPYI